MSTTLKLDQVQFPAVQVPSSDPNNLDDYEEGTWVPVLGGDGGATGQTYGLQRGSYVKIGRMVTLTFEVLLSAKGTLTGTLAAITGLPFAAGAGIAAAAGAIGYATNFASNVQSVGCYIGSGGSTMFLNGAATTGVSPLDNLVKAAIGNTTYLIGSATYFV